MRTPPFLIFACLIFWGLQTDHLPLSFAMALLLEAQRAVKIRWDISAMDFKRVSDLCAVLSVGATAWFFASNRPREVIVILMQWLPVILFPLVVSQVYSISGKVDLSAVSLISRRLEKTRRNPNISVDLVWPYFALCMISASAANVRTVWFYMGIFILSVPAFFANRSARYTPVLWGFLLVSAAMAGFAGQHGLHRLQLFLEEKSYNWFKDSLKEPDPYRNITAIGDIGRLKPSRRIVFRVKPESGTNPPLLLREASYNAFGYLGWAASGAKFSEIRSLKGDNAWNLKPGADSKNAVIVSSFLHGGKGMLKLPGGTVRIEELPVFRMEKNRFAAVRVDEGPGLVSCRVLFDPGTSIDGVPGRHDLMIPERESEAVLQIAGKLDFSNAGPKEVLQRTESFFRKNFKYSLDLKIKNKKKSPISRFLLENRSGHCEYFATSAVLLLRAAGIPARYATGYSAHEYSELEDMYVVRESHAHAWVLAFIDGVWRNFDPTPPSWIQSDAAENSFLNYLSDLKSWLLYEFFQWRAGWSGGRLRKILPWLLIPLVAYLSRNLFKKRNRRKISETKAEAAPLVLPGSDSEFYRIEKMFAESGFVRLPGETLANWLKRVKTSDAVSHPSEALETALSLHYKYRFDPAGITDEQRATLESTVKSLLENHSRP